MEVNKHSVKAGSVIIFTFDYEKLSAGLTGKKIDKFMKNLIQDIKNALPVDSVVTCNEGVIKSIDILENHEDIRKET